MAYSRLNYIENLISNKVVAAGSAETSWKHYAAYSKKHPTGSWTKYKTETMASTGAGATHTLTTVSRDWFWIWKAKSETIGGKKKQQYYKIKSGNTVLNGFLTLIPDTYFSNIAEKYSRVLLCKDANAPAAVIANAPNVVPQPTTFNVSFEDFDSIKSGSGKDVTYTTGINRSESSGYLTRNRIRANLRTLTIEWSFATAEDAQKILSKVNESQWVLVNFLDPLTNTNMSKTFCLTSKSVEGFYRNNYRNISITYEEV